jgi:hypothetical protein
VKLRCSLKQVKEEGKVSFIFFISYISLGTLAFPSGNNLALARKLRQTIILKLNWLFLVFSETIDWGIMYFATKNAKINKTIFFLLLIFGLSPIVSSISSKLIFDV